MSIAKRTIRNLEEYFGDIFNNDNKDDSKEHFPRINNDNNDDSKEIELDEKLYGKQYRIDKNKNGIVDREDLRMTRSKKSETKENEMYELHLDESTGEKINPFAAFIADAANNMSPMDKQGLRNLD